MSWTMFNLYVLGGVSGLTFLYYFYKANYKLYKTEILLIAAFHRLPLYSAPGPPVAERNSTIKPEGLPADVVEAFAQWFVQTDAQQPDGVARDDVLELFHQLGFSEEDEECKKACKGFLAGGESHLEERRRLSGCGIQESLTLLAKLALEGDEDDASRPCKLGEKEIDMMSRKFDGLASVRGGAAALQQALQFQGVGNTAPGASSAVVPPGTLAAAGGPTSAPGTGGFPSLAHGPDTEAEPAQLPAGGDAGVMDEAQHQQIMVSRLQRMENDILATLERRGSLSLAEESRLRDVREQKAALGS